MNMRNYVCRSSCLKLAIVVLMVTVSGLAFSKKDAAQDYTLWKDTKFHRFFVRKDVDFSRYTKVAFLPMDYKSMVLAKKTKRGLKRSWSTFVESEMPNIANRFNEEVKSALAKNTNFESTDKGGKDVLVVSFKALEVTPKAPLDNGMATVGKSTLSLVGYFKYQLVAIDGHTKQIVAMIEDDHTIAPNTRATGEQPNNLGNHRRAWSVSMKGWIKRFFSELNQLPGRKA